jgi:rubrerythrin
MSKISPPNEKEALTEKNISSPMKRREFFRFTGLSAAAAALIMPGCKQIEDFIGDPKTPVDVKAVVLGSGDIGILNYAYALEQLEAAFYTQVVATPYRGMGDTVMNIMKDLMAHEVIHREFLKMALGVKAIRSLTFDFSKVDFKDRESVLQTAQAFEDLGVSAYNGAGKLLQNPDFLMVAGKIVSVEARHASVIREQVKLYSFADTTDMNGLDPARMPMEVLNMAQTFIVEKIFADTLPKA